MDKTKQGNGNEGRAGVGTIKFEEIVLKYTRTTGKKMDIVPWLVVRDWTGRMNHKEYTGFLSAVEDKVQSIRKGRFTVGYKFKNINKGTTMAEFAEIPFTGGFMEFDTKFLKGVVENDRLDYVINRAVSLLRDTKLEKLGQETPNPTAQ